MSTVIIRVEPARLRASARGLGALARGPLADVRQSLAGATHRLETVWFAPAAAELKERVVSRLIARLDDAARDLQLIDVFLARIAEIYAVADARLARDIASPQQHEGRAPGLNRLVRPAGDAPGFYVIVAGDTLWDIARRFGTTVEALRRANGLTGDLIFPGQRLSLPGPEVDSPPLEPDPQTPAGIVKVRTGDTLWEIARVHGTTVAALRAANGIRGDLIYPGQQLVVPASGDWAVEPVPGLPAGEAVLLPGAYISGYAWLEHPGHYAIDLNTLSDDKVLRAPYVGTRIVADSCPALTADGNSTGQLIAGTPFGPENNWGYGALAIVETRFDELTSEQVADLAARGVELTPGQSLYVMVAHLQPDQIPAPGAALLSGDAIALMGTSGNSTGPHAHVELAVAPSLLRPNPGQNSASFWIGSIVGVANGALAQGRRLDPSALFVGP